MEDPTIDEMREFLNEQFPKPDYDVDAWEFDREEAIYWFAANYHAGQSSNLCVLTLVCLLFGHIGG